MRHSAAFGGHPGRVVRHHPASSSSSPASITSARVRRHPALDAGGPQPSPPVRGRWSSAAVLATCPRAAGVESDQVALAGPPRPPGPVGSGAGRAAEAAGRIRDLARRTARIPGRLADRRAPPRRSAGSTSTFSTSRCRGASAATEAHGDAPTPGSPSICVGTRRVAAAGSQSSRGEHVTSDQFSRGDNPQPGQAVGVRVFRRSSSSSASCSSTRARARPSKLRHATYGMTAQAHATAAAHVVIRHLDFLAARVPMPSVVHATQPATVENEAQREA